MELVEGSKIENIKTEEVDEENIEEKIKLTEEMVKFCADNGGAGLAAPQVGINEKIVVWAFNDNYLQACFNPIYYPDSNKKTNTIEGCLSYPERNFYMERYKYIRAVYYLPNKDKNGLIKVAKKMRGEEAIVFQHEVDHLYGKTIFTEGKEV